MYDSSDTVIVEGRIDDDAKCDVDYYNNMPVETTQRFKSVNIGFLISPRVARIEFDRR